MNLNGLGHKPRKPVELHRAPLRQDKYYVGPIFPQDVVILNLSETVSIAELRQFCSKFGDVADSKLYTHPNSGRSVGMARTSFKRSSCARDCAEQLHGRRLPGHPSNVLTAFVDGVFNMCRQKIFEIAIRSMGDARRAPNWPLLFKRLRLEDLLPADLVEPEPELKPSLGSATLVNAVAVLQSSPPFESHDLKAEPSTLPLLTLVSGTVEAAPSSVPESRALLATPNSFSPRSDVANATTTTSHLPTTEASLFSFKSEPITSASPFVNYSSLSSAQCNSSKPTVSEHILVSSASSTPASFLSSFTATFLQSSLNKIPLPPSTSSPSSGSLSAEAASAPVPPVPAPPPPPASALPVAPPPPPLPLPLLGAASAYSQIGTSPLLQTGHYGLPVPPPLPPLPFPFLPGFVPPRWPLPIPPPPAPASLSSSTPTATAAAVTSSVTCSTSIAAARTSQPATPSITSLPASSTKTSTNG